MHFANNQSTTAPPLPRRSEASPGGALVTSNKAKALVAFHSRQSASARTAAEEAAAAASAADLRVLPQQQRQRQRRDEPTSTAAAKQRPPTPDLCVIFFLHEVGEYAFLSQFFHSEFTDDTGQTYSCMEHIMMAEKAKAMGDETSRALILASENDPAEFNKLGRRITPWIQEV